MLGSSNTLDTNSVYYLFSDKAKVNTMNDQQETCRYYVCPQDSSETLREILFLIHRLPIFGGDVFNNEDKVQ